LKEKKKKQRNNSRHYTSVIYHVHGSTKEKDLRENSKPVRLKLKKFTTTTTHILRNRKKTAYKFMLST